ncbi:MBOAT family O-acyltransferase [uncultured Clostridium sp.]|uniref:MBOAT family O-acyltransferase n=1 Tax=uncultured Clostridium sp. TaxID=59620 RepID=UPI0025ED5A76|nr:MBOAT family O-acyltransferase [uncultured Clostridium sp.]
MIFSSLLFMYIFLPIVLGIYYFSPKKLRNFVLLMISLVFYGWGEPIYIFLMIISIIVGFTGARLIDKYRDNKDFSTCIFITVLVLNIGALFFFKYYGFLIEIINSVFNSNLRIRTLPLPLGISFYTFQIISYVVDVYKRDTKVQKNIINFGAYVSMFPQLVAGPIVQYTTIEKQLNSREENLNQFGEGVERFVLGLGKKVIIANNVGAVWNTVKPLVSSDISVLTSWIGIIAFTLQIYFDFSGYSDMAIGLGKMFGFDFMENFKYPYISKSVTEFWRRWHISLGSWFRDYIYIPLGGNRCSKIANVRNIFVVWFVTGLWHGASWNFIVWGLFFGVIIFIEKMGLLKVLDKLPSFLCNIYTMFFVVISWVFFDTYTLKDSMVYIGNMFGLNNNIAYDNMACYLLDTNKVFFITAIVCSTPLIKYLIEYLKKSLIGKIVLIMLYIGIIIISTSLLVGESYNPFLYFRF